jgi:hypothetical protein
MWALWPWSKRQSMTCSANIYPQMWCVALQASYRQYRPASLHDQPSNRQILPILQILFRNREGCVGHIVWDIWYLDRWNRTTKNANILFSLSTIFGCTFLLPVGLTNLETNLSPYTTSPMHNIRVRSASQKWLPGDPRSARLVHYGETRPRVCSNI